MLIKEEWKNQFNDYKSKLEAWYDNLAEREKQIVTFGGIGIVILLIHAIVYSPLVNHAANLRAKITTEQKTLVWMQAADKQIQAIEGQASNKDKTVSPVVMLSILQKRITQLGLDRYLTQMKQASNDAIQLQFQKVAFDKVMTLLISVAKENKIIISQLSVTAEATPGVANVDVMITLG